MADRERRDALPVDFHNDREHRKKLAERTNQIEQELRDDTGAGVVGVDSSGFSTNLTTAIKTLQDALDEIDALTGSTLTAVVLKSLFDANTIIAADTDNTPTARAIAEDRIIGRKSGGAIGALTAAEVLDILGMDPPIGALIAIIEDQQTSGTDGGTFTSGADRTRVLNTLVYNLDMTVGLSSNQITLPAGDWEIEWEAPAYRVDNHQSFLYDVTGAAEAKRGSTMKSANGDTTMGGASRGSARVSPSGANVYEIRHRGTTTQNTNGFGQAASFGTEVYTRVIIRKA